MENELDLVTFTDEEGNEITMEVLDYLCYEGKVSLMTNSIPAQVCPSDLLFNTVTAIVK